MWFIHFQWGALLATPVVWKIMATEKQVGRNGVLFIGGGHFCRGVGNASGKHTLLPPV
jgi:hypothetical protein